MKTRILNILLLLFLLSCECECQVPSIGGMQRPGVVTGSAEMCKIGTSAYFGEYVFSEDDQMMETHLNSDGTKMFCLGYNSDKIYEYNLSTPFIVSTASYSGNSFSFSSQEPTGTMLDFNPDGTIMYIGGYSTDKIYQYTLSTAWDLSTASYSSKSTPSLSTEATVPYMGLLADDGTKLYILSKGPLPRMSIAQYTLSTAWDLSTASYVGYYDMVDLGNYGADGEFNADGTKFFFNTSGTYYIETYELETPYDFTGTVTYLGDSYYNGGIRSYGYEFSSDYNYWYINTYDGARVTQYSLCN